MGRIRSVAGAGRAAGPGINPAVLNELGVRMLSRGAAEQAHALCSCAATAGGFRAPSTLGNLASSLKALGRRAEEMDAIEKALELEPRTPVVAAAGRVPTSRRSGDPRNARAAAYQNALACICTGLPRVPIGHSRRAQPREGGGGRPDSAALSAALEEPLAAVPRNAMAASVSNRVDLCLATLMGKR